MEHHTAKQRQVKLTSPDGRWSMKVWFRTDRGERIEVELPGDGWIVAEAEVHPDRTSRLVFKRV